MKIAALILLTFLGFDIFSQSKPTPVLKCEQVQNKSDCITAKEIVPMGRIKVVCTPEGYGHQLEFKRNRLGDLHYFEKEHNTVWFKFKAYKDATLVFRIKPRDKHYDYDFLLFKDTTDFCELLAQKKVIPVRSNLSRNDTSRGSITGLAYGADSSFVPAGPAAQFSKHIKVKKGEKYYLVIDNVYGGTKGFFLYFDYFKTKLLSGEIKDEETGEPVVSTIEWQDEKTGKILAETETDSVGKFSFEVPYSSNSKASYILSAFNHKYFFGDSVFKSIDLKPTKIDPIKIELPKIKKGKRVRFNNINFHGGSPVPLSGAKGSMKKLYKTMSKNPNLEILIEGHVNGCPGGIEANQKLSDDRAKAIKDYLVNKGIETNRIKTKGFSCTRMLYPLMENEWQQRQNRRVEIVVLDF